MTSTLLGIALATAIGSSQVISVTSAPGSALQQTTNSNARMMIPNRVSDMNAMFVALNAHRNSMGLAALHLDPTLCTIAYQHAADMVARSYFDHNTPEGLSPFARMDQAHYPYGYAGENIALDSSGAAAEQALWHSSEHRENILSAHFAKVGIAAVAGSQGEVIVEDFSD